MHLDAHPKRLVEPAQISARFHQLAEDYRESKEFLKIGQANIVRLLHIPELHTWWGEEFHDQRREI
jgi:hypothetical protein